MAGRSTPIRLSRRRLLVASSATLAAGAPVALTACGTGDEDDEPSPAREAELLLELRGHQLAVMEVADRASRVAPSSVGPSLERLSTLRQDSAKALGTEISKLDALSPGYAAGVVIAEAESPVERVARQLDSSIAATLAAIGELTPERRQPLHRAIVEDAAALAALRDTLGEEVAPDAFVLGRPAAEEGES